MSHPGQHPEARSATGAGQLNAAIADLWRDAQPRALARVTVLERAVAALRSGDLPPELADEARREAHKLAGSLGTFGMPAGTDHARAVELRLEAGVARHDAAELGDHVARLREIIASSSR